MATGLLMERAVSVHGEVMVVLVVSIDALVSMIAIRLMRARPRQAFCVMTFGLRLCTHIVLADGLDGV